MYLDSSLLSGKTFVMTDSSNGDAAVHVYMDGYVVDLSSLTIDDTTVASFSITGAVFGATGGLTITGSSVADSVTGGASGDVITTGDGADTIVDAGAGADTITTGAGNDTVTDAGSGADTIYLGTGDDTVTDAGSVNDTI